MRRRRWLRLVELEEREVHVRRAPRFGSEGERAPGAVVRELPKDWTDPPGGCGGPAVSGLRTGLGSRTVNTRHE